MLMYGIDRPIEPARLSPHLSVAKSRAIDAVTPASKNTTISQNSVYPSQDCSLLY